MAQGDRCRPDHCLGPNSINVQRKPLVPYGRRARPSIQASRLARHCRLQQGSLRIIPG
ncbi:hypothetical protein [Azospirillum palustre]